MFGLFYLARYGKEVELRKESVVRHIKNKALL